MGGGGRRGGSSVSSSASGLHETPSQNKSTNTYKNEKLREQEKMVPKLKNEWISYVNYFNY